MTDFAKLTGQPAAIDESLEAFEFKPEGFQNGAGKPLALTMHPGGGTRFKRSVRKMHVKAVRSQADSDQSEELTEADLEAELDEQDGRSAELLARLCDGWNMTDGKDPIEFSLANATALFTQVEPLRLAVDKEITARGKKPKAKKTA
ncbi:MAG: hypothetical protein KBT76_14750 [Sulfitobacter litoralis]|nr:hypothetical protein [Sulfitobacter litoralis]